jgi:hypothetical protein
VQIKSLFGRASKPAPAPAPREALPNGVRGGGSTGGAPKIRSLEPRDGGGARKCGSTRLRALLDLLVLARGSEARVKAGDASRKARAEATAAGRRRRGRRPPLVGGGGGAGVGEGGAREEEMDEREWKERK